MDSMAGALVLGTVGALALLGLWKGAGGYDAFLRGAGDGLRTGLEILPALAAMMLLIGLFRAAWRNCWRDCWARWQRPWAFPGKP